MLFADNTEMQRLNINLMGITLISPVTSQARKIFSAVMLAFAAMLRVNSTLRCEQYMPQMSENLILVSICCNAANQFPRTEDLTGIDLPASLILPCKTYKSSIMNMAPCAYK